MAFVQNRDGTSEHRFDCPQELRPYDAHSFQNRFLSAQSGISQEVEQLYLGERRTGRSCEYNPKLHQVYWGEVCQTSQLECRV